MLTPATDSRSIALPTGRLDIAIEEAAWSLDDLCAFAARENPKRGFLVVSRVLGRHLPATPQVMRRSVRDLAARIPADLPGPVMVIGLAETAVCLGQTVHEELRTATGRDDIHFLHSTRQQLDHPLLCRFEEPHSHASAHLIYRPDLPEPRSLVLVDDEVSTGTTLCNLADALVAAWPGIEAIVVATLTDWSVGKGWQARMPRPAQVAALLRGRLDWTQGETAQADAAFNMAAASLGRMDAHRNFGRLGLAASIATPPVTALPEVSGPLRIAGTGEFTYLPFRLAERLAGEGRDVVVQATSRSPARLGAAMATKLCFTDNYGTGVPNYLYNADPADGRANWIAHETGAATIDPALIAALDARLVGWA
ncbi:phosphoribosyltransferase domain-containing protein [Sphingomonas sp. S2-65]|uniref:phosphoribosyltransferase domain-containing protein n=1 Tax=Sphingomonas sp. S2-65 TaxID=2903960 RepID=UPI001F3E57C1|nr:phosphoribosyltransferase domain-containing protein [Sphingomonas sp. S2-65]UYY59289.1 phosphoribosyltransferase family protein [Sphingomonas sp. S2-65]